MDWLSVFRRGIPWNELASLERSAVAAAVGGERSLLAAEPGPTLTCGRSGGSGEILAPETELARRGVAIASVARGGRWTYHGPGQIVLFPVVRLRDLGLGRHAISPFLEAFRRGVRAFLGERGIETSSAGGPFGLYVGRAKIASFGISVRQGIVSHGVAVYLTPQNEGFRWIHPCGVPDQALTSIAELGGRTDWPEAAQTLVNRVAESLVFRG